jgi:hypothetical protein
VHGNERSEMVIRIRESGATGREIRVNWSSFAFKTVCCANSVTKRERERLPFGQI